MERVRALAGVGNLVRGGLLIGAAEIQGHRFEPGAAISAEFVVEALEDGVVLAIRGPDHHAAAVVVGDHGQVAVALAVGDLVHADPVEVPEPASVDVLGDHSHHDAGHGLPARAQQLGDGGLVGALGEPRHDVFEVAGDPRPRASPRHRLSADPTAAPAVQAADLGLQEQLRAAQIQVPPPTDRPVIDRTALPAARAHRPAAAAPQPDHDTLRRERDRHDTGPDDGQQLVECSGDAHVHAPRRLGWLRNPEPTKRHVRVP